MQLLIHLIRYSSALFLALSIGTASGITPDDDPTFNPSNGKGTYVINESRDDATAPPSAHALISTWTKSNRIKILKPMESNAENLLPIENLHFNYTKQAILESLFTGLIVSTSIIALFFMIMLRESTYLWFSLFCLSITIICYNITESNLIFYWINHLETNEPLVKACSILCILFSIVFSEKNLKKSNTTLNSHSLKNASIAIGIFMLIGIVCNITPSIIIAIYVILCSIYFTFFSYLSWNNGSRSAIYFSYGWTTLLITSIFYLTSGLDINENTTAYKLGILSGASITVLFFLIGLMKSYSFEPIGKSSLSTKKHETALQLKEAEARLVQKALHSNATELPNRTLLLSRLENLLNDRSIQKSGISLALIGIRNFHEINKTLGYKNGDTILRKVSEKLSRLISMFPTSCPIEQTKDNKSLHLAAINGVMFSAIFKTKNSDLIDNYIREIIQLFNTPLEFHGMPLELHTNIGVKIAKQGDNCANTLLTQSQIAFQYSRQYSKTVSYYDTIPSFHSTSKLTLIKELSLALERGEITAYFQPQICINTTTIVGIDTSIQWKHPVKGFIPPTEFIPIAEKTGIIHPLTEWIAQRSLALYNQLKHQGLDIPISIKIHTNNLYQPNFCEMLSKKCHSMSIPTSKIILELSEKNIMTDEKKLIDMIKEIISNEFHIAFNNFGYGQFLLSSLKRIPLQQINIDLPFISASTNTNNRKKTIEAIINMARSLKIKVVAKGIKDSKTLALLKAIQCPSGQGHHIAKPMKQDAFIEWSLQHTNNRSI